MPDTSNATLTDAAADSEKPSEVVWSHTTARYLMSDEGKEYFMLAIPDRQKIHTDDDVARALPFQWKGRIMHGAMIRDLALNVLILEHLPVQTGCAETHFVVDQGGPYVPVTAVYPGEEIYARYNYKGRVRPRATFPFSITYAVFVDRGDVETCVMKGTHNLLAVYIKKT